MYSHRFRYRSRIRQTVLCLATAGLLTTTARAEVELAPHAGFRMGGDVEIRESGSDLTTELSFKDSESFGIVLNVDLDEAGKQMELYFARQETTARADVLLTPGTFAVDLTIYQLQFGGLYFPGGRTTGGFVSGVVGVTRLDPKSSGLDEHHRASISLGGGYKLALTESLLARFDLRGIYTALDSGGSVFCDGGCTVRFDSSGFFQAEISAGLALRF
ncbi:hypothetical protein SAMN05216203_2830 [Marinobacter daqiaonensis]|uniref:Outer membrane protein beta-barrel domain-containing protein n=1 Tax=Marinobacter daqiaonensis TaxID=650891 RepID=A0A1I6JAF0_9GAMM|nr:hypothetical protein [Marinobacter daqiaonensis]SFR75921.1 hypothetical protein SAMN05216203_2830 [Marinobacter daqiaonensis]